MTRCCHVCAKTKALNLQCDVNPNKLISTLVPPLNILNVHSTAKRGRTSCSASQLSPSKKHERLAFLNDSVLPT